MGWDCRRRPNGQTPKDFFDQYFASGGDCAVIKSAVRAGTYYGALKIEDKPVFAVVVIFEWGAGPQGFRYKIMEESMGPYQYCCPADVLAALDPLPASSGGYAAAWREKCRANLSGAKA